MTFPLTLSDVSLLLAVEAIVLLITSELLSPYYGEANLKMNKKRLQYAAIAIAIAFLITVALRIASILINS